MNLYGGRISGVVSRDHTTFLGSRFRLTSLERKKKKTKNLQWIALLHSRHRERRQGFPHQRYPSSCSVEIENFISIWSNLIFSRYDGHINGALLRQNFGGASSLVVKGDVGTNFFHELNFLLRTSGADDLEALGFRDLDDKSRSSVPLISFFDERGRGDPRSNRASACWNKDSLALGWVIIRVIEVRRWDNSPSLLGNIPSKLWKRSFLKLRKWVENWT